MPNFIRKSRLVEAIQFDGENIEEMNKFIFPDGVPEGKPFGKLMFLSSDGRVLIEKESENDTPFFSFHSQNVIQKVYPKYWVVKNPTLDKKYQLKVYDNSFFHNIFQEI
jgi:hypothetical protein